MLDSHEMSDLNNNEISVSTSVKRAFLVGENSTITVEESSNRHRGSVASNNRQANLNNQTKNRIGKKSIFVYDSSKSWYTKSTTADYDNNEDTISYANNSGNGNDFEEEFDPFQRTGYLFGCLAKEVKYRYSRYLSDYADALNLHCLVAFVFTFTVCLAPALSFGGILGKTILHLEFCVQNEFITLL